MRPLKRRPTRKVLPRPRGNLDFVLYIIALLKMHELFSQFKVAGACRRLDDKNEMLGCCEWLSGCCCLVAKVLYTQTYILIFWKKKYIYTYVCVCVLYMLKQQESHYQKSPCKETVKSLSNRSTLAVTVRLYRML